MAALRRKSKSKKKWIQASKERMKRKGTIGSLRRIAKKKKGEKISRSELQQLARSKNPKVRKKAQWALNVGAGRTKRKRRKR